MDEGIIKCAQGISFLHDDFTYSLLAEIKLPSCYPQEDGTALRVRDTAHLFNTLFFDRINNILIHMLLQEDRTFSDILRTFTNNHGYVSANTLRYHLDKKICYCGKDFPLFKLVNGKYAVPENIRQANDIFDEFLEKYDKDIDIRVDRLLNSRLYSLADRNIEIVAPNDNMRKIVQMLTYTKYLLVLSSKPEGVITMGNLMNTIGRGAFEDIGFSSMTARDLMRPITESEVLPPNMTLGELFKKYKRLKNNHYVVDGDSSYSILDVYSLVRKLPYIHEDN
jgi:hypothetical protein